jgi:FtsZ-binding cell division protein ZapB
MAGCQSANYKVWEQLGKEKRHLLRDHVQYARNDQQQASEEFKDALTRVKEVYGFSGGDLESYYNRLKDDYDRCQERARVIDERIDQMERIAKDLFREWEYEIKAMTNENFKQQSRQSMENTKKRYAQLSKTAVAAKDRMKPVLARLNDYVLYLKHNLNAQAVGALQKEARGIETDVDVLIVDMTRSIQEADVFLKDFE